MLLSDPRAKAIPLEFVHRMVVFAILVLGMRFRMILPPPLIELSERHLCGGCCGLTLGLLSSTHGGA